MRASKAVTLWSGVAVSGLTLFLWVMPSTAVGREMITVAVASNFQVVARELAEQFEADHGVPVRLVSASSGKLFAQVVHGAPFDVLLAADQKTPQKLESMGLAVDGSRFTYALGRLVLWTRDPTLRDASCESVLRSGAFQKLSVANARHAPYGAASEQALQNMGLRDELHEKRVIGENIAQTFQFAATGNASLGLVALSQALDPNAPEATCMWIIPADLYAPIVQQALLLRRAQANPMAHQFLHDLRTERARKLIVERGYAVIDMVGPQ